MVGVPFSGKSLISWELWGLSSCSCSFAARQVGQEVGAPVQYLKQEKRKLAGQKLLCPRCPSTCIELGVP